MKVMMIFSGDEVKEWHNLRVKMKHDCIKKGKPMFAEKHRLADGTYVGILVAESDRNHRSSSTSSISSYSVSPSDGSSPKPDNTRLEGMGSPSPSI